MKEFLIDVLEHIPFAIDIEAIKFDLNEDSEIYALEINKKVIVNAKIKGKDLELQGCFGIKNTSQLYSFLSDSNLSITSISTNNSNSNKITFKSSKTQNTVEHYFISKKILDETVKYARLTKPVSWYASIEVTKELVDKITQQLKVNKDEHFVITNEKDKVLFSFSDYVSSATGSIVVNPFYTFNINKSYIKSLSKLSTHNKHYPAKTIKNILSNSGKMTMYVSTDDYIIIICETEYCTYEYILPGCGK